MKSKLSGKLLVAAMAAITAMAVLVPAAQAKTPAPGYEKFAGCPSPEENPKIEGCIHSTVTGGHFKMGNKDVPITNPIVVSGGVEDELKGFSYNSKGGMPPVKQKVPGGVVGLTGLTWLLEILGSEALTLYAATELAGQPTVGFTEISLPIKVHLINSVLGKNCYVGSNSNPIKLKMTGEPSFGFDPKLNVILLDGTYTDNTFSAPGASGCVLTLFGFIPISINGLVNSASGLPAATGNETEQVIHTEIAPSFLVYK